MPAMHSSRFILLLIAAGAVAAAQSPAPTPMQTKSQPQQIWQMQDSGTTAGLRGIHSVDGTVAWASGTDGTVLKTTDGGAHWQKCAVPDAATDGATLDFRGVHAWDAQTAIVMASGPGDKSRLYRTVDGCKRWKLVLKNHDKGGFWDTVYFFRDESGWLFGDPTKDHFALFRSYDAGRSWYIQTNKGLRVAKGTQGAFAASNSSLVARGAYVSFGTGGTAGSFIYSVTRMTVLVDGSFEQSDYQGRETQWDRESVPIGGNSPSSGVFSIGSGPLAAPYGTVALVAVGGDYTKPAQTERTAAFKSRYDQPWTASITPPHGYRSTVQWSDSEKLWITAGTNGSDISRDDGRTWQPLDNGNWNALSLPFIVGPNGRIAKLNPSSIPKH